MGFKILNLSTGYYYNGAIGSEHYELPDSSYRTKEEAEKQIDLMILTAEIIKGSKLIREHLVIEEII